MSILPRAADAVFSNDRIVSPHHCTVASDDRTSVAIEILASRDISELPVVDSHGRPDGLVDITDMVIL